MDIPADLLHTIYVKTGKAHEEMIDRRHGLRPKARQVLIMLDGARTVGMLTAVIAGFELPQILQELERTGFIAPLSTETVQQVPHLEAITLTAAPEEVDPLALLEIKLLMQESIQQNLGLLGADLKKQVAAIRDAAGLRATMARWHMALRESRKGADSADELLQKARALAGWEA